MSLSNRTKRWLSDNCLHSLKGKTALITGANSGVGFKMAEIMVYLGAAVIMACRDPGKASAARAALLGEYPGAEISVMALDLADFASIDAFAQALRARRADIDAFVNNAGVFHQPGKQTANGLELVIGTNYIGTYYLSQRALPYLTTLPHGVYYINTISMVHRFATVDYRDFYCARRYRDLTVYARSKLCLARYSLAMAERYANSNVRVLMSHPGIALTPMCLDAYGLKRGQPLVRLGSPLFNSPEKSALPLAYILSHDVPAGSVIGPDRGLGGWGYPKPNRVCRRAKEGAEELIRFTDREIARAAGVGAASPEPPVPRPPLTAGVDSER